MSVLIVRDGALVTQDVNDALVYEMDWDTENLSNGVTISNSSFTITQLKGAALPALTKDNEAILSGSRDTQLRLSGGSVGALYRIDNTIVTSETPAQTKDRHFKLLIQQK